MKIYYVTTVVDEIEGKIVILCGEKHKTLQEATTCWQTMPASTKAALIEKVRDADANVAVMCIEDHTE